MPDNRILVCGAGIGGLSALRALQRAGIGATVFDRAQDVRSVQVGGGFVLWNNGMRALQELGVEQEILAVSSPPLQRFELRSWRGPTLIHWPVAETSAQIGAPSVGILRKDLFGVLFNAVDKADLQMGCESTGFSQDEGQVRLQFANAESAQGTVLVGADGNRSVVRGQLNGPNDLVYAGYSLWHSVVEADPDIVREATNCTIWGRGIRIIFYPVGGNRMYFSCILRCREEELSQFGPMKERLLEAYRGWPHPVEELIASADEAQIRRSDIYGRQPVEHWGEGRVTLLGDAAHPMTPNQGQGACLALEDAVELVRCLQKEADPITALRVYEQRRQPRTARVLKRSWTVGRSGAVANPVAVWLRERGMKLRGESVVQGLRDNMVYQFR